jgi:GH35 family endo-1,4-beta-xylanase
VCAVCAGAVAEKHPPWELDGAQERIEKHRMGECRLQLVLPDGSAVPSGTPLKAEQTRHAFYFGGSLAADWQVPKQDWYPDFKARFANLFNYATIDFYWSVHEKKPGQWRYDPESRQKLDWAGAQGMRLRGHPLMWHEVLPDWIASTNRPVEDLDRDILEHVRMLVETYPMIDEWDLYNEGPGIRYREPAHGVRRWMESVGGPGPVAGHILDAVQRIRPDARFILNHFTDNDPEYREQIGYCLSNNVPFDAIGIQTHMHTVMDTLSEERLWNALETYAQYRLPIQLSEISILSCDRFGDWDSFNAWKAGVVAAKRKGAQRPVLPSTPELERDQAELARDFYTLAFSHPAVEAIVWWTITDLEPWRGMPAGLLDADGNPKPVYRELDRLINREWKTEFTGAADRAGQVAFRGFYGSYELTVRHGGRTLRGSFDLSRDRDGVQKVTVTESTVKK